MISHLIQLQVVQRQWTPKWQILVNDLTIIQYLFRFHIIQPTFVGNKNILCALSLQILQFSIQKMAGIHIDVFSLSLPISYANRNDKSVIILVQPSIVIAKKPLRHTGAQFIRSCKLNNVCFFTLLFSNISNA